MDYPDKFIRGISSRDFVDEDGRVLASIFQFLDTNRADGFYESSINWYDDEDALLLILEQRKEKDKTEYQFKYGAAIIGREEADRIISNPSYKSIFAYERSPIEGNKYHGNLLRKGKSNKGIHTIIAAYLAMNAQLISRQ